MANKMKIIADKHIYKVEEAFHDLGSITPLSGRLIKPDLELLRETDMLLVRSVTQVNEELLANSTVKFVASASIGIDHVDTDYLRENQIGFAHAPGSSADSVAEYVVAALLEIAIKRGCKLNELTLGIVGAGNVGSRVSHLASALGMKCVLNDPPKKNITNSDVYRPIEEIFERCDIVSLHVPLVMNGDYPTYHMVNGEFVARMKQGAALINSSRGRVIDEESFKTVCSRLGMIVLDVFEKEPAISVDMLRIADIATPHIAGYSLDGKLRGTDMIYRAAVAFFYKELGWDSDKSELHKKRMNIDLTASKDPIYDAVKSAYSIMKDDQHFRHIYSVPDDQKVKFFECLRSDYPKRLEFTHFDLTLSSQHKKEADVLKKLRFNVTLK